MAVSGLHTYYWVWSGPKLQLTVLKKLLGDSCVHCTGKQCRERWIFLIDKCSSACLSSFIVFLILLVGIIVDGCVLRSKYSLVKEMLLKCSSPDWR